MSICHSSIKRRNCIKIENHTCTVNLRHPSSRYTSCLFNYSVSWVTFVTYNSIELRLFFCPGTMLVMQKHSILWKYTLRIWIWKKQQEDLKNRLSSDNMSTHVHWRRGRRFPNACPCESGVLFTVVWRNSQESRNRMFCSSYLKQRVFPLTQQLFSCWRLPCCCVQ